MPAAAFPRWLRVSTLTLYRLVTWTILVAGFGFSAVVLGLRYWVLPNIDQHRETVARVIANAVGQPVTIGRISGNWDGLRPQLLLDDVTLFDGDGRAALKFLRIEGVLSWFSLAAWEPRFRVVELHQPALDIRRDGRGAIYVAGIELKEGEGGGFVDWLLRQRKLSIRRAAISWHDEMQGAAPLQLTQVDFLVRNRGSRHRFGMRGVPPQALAGPLDVRGELFGRSASTLGMWQGRLFVQFERVNIDAWRAWLPASIPASKGTGALRMWAAIREQRLTEVNADVRLADVRVRLAPDVPELEVAALSGRVGWKDVPGGLEVSTSGLALSGGEGLMLEPTDFFLRVNAGHDGAAERGEIRANALALEPLAMLADRLPIDSDLRRQFVALAPKGRVMDLAIRWNGDWRSPAQYVAGGRFEALGATAADGRPGFSGVTGAFEGNEKTGTIRLDSSHVTLDMPNVFRGPLEFETLTAEIGLSHGGQAPELQFNKVAIANAHFAGSVSGTYRVVPDGRGVIDVTGSLTRGDARYVAHYVPLVIGPATREWLDSALLSGQSTDVSLRLKGDLNAFPFPDNKGGVFEVVAKVTDGVLDYATGWPKIENIAGEVAFRGKRMEVNARQGTILGAKLVKVHAEIPDVVHHYEILRIAGEAEGPSAEFLSYIEKSPVLDMIDRFTEGMRMQGNGKLALNLEIPLREREKSKVAGNFQFGGNRFVASPDLPPFEQASGRLEFTETTVRVPNATATFLGGPLVVSTAPQGDATARINVQGRTNIENLRQSAGNARWMQHISGAADWKGSVILRKKLADVFLESNLQGVASDLPAPLNKTAADELPLRIERRFISPAQGLTDRIDATLGDILSARLIRRHGAGKDIISRGTVRFGGPASEPERDGVWVSGVLNRLDLDRWLAVGADGKQPVEADLSGVDVKLGDLQVLNRVFHDFALSGTAEGGGWRATLSGREFDGTVKWESQGRGKLVARMKKLVIPAALPDERRDETSDRGRELPAVDLIAEQFTFKDKALGKLELTAAPVERDWRIDRLHLSNPDGVLAVEGLVRDMGSQQPRTRATVRLDVSDIGKLLARLGYPEGVRRGTAKLEGTLAWPGGAQDFGYGALAGNLKLDAAKGQFVKLEPGIGKLLGILSLQALPRRVALDFRDIFSEGFAFDQITGEVSIDRGIASANNFRMQGPAARVAMTGEVDLVRETQKLHVRVTPSLSDSVSIAGVLLGGPVAGVATILAQKILKDPLDQIFAYEYNVTGTWAEPQVSKIERPAPATTEAN